MNRKKILIPIIILTVIIILLIVLEFPRHRYKNMFVNKSKWESLQNSLEENTELMFESIKFNDYNLIIDEQNSKIYYSLVESSKTKYNPSISYTIADENAKLAILQDEITFENIQENYEFKLMIYNDSYYHVYSLICVDYPMINISYEQKNEEELKNISVNISIFDNVSNISNRTIISRGKIEILENNEYTLSLSMMSPGKNKRKNSISIFGMSPHNKYKLSYEDNETKEEKTENTQYVELFINSQYQGLYSLEQLIKKEDN